MINSYFFAKNPLWARPTSVIRRPAPSSVVRLQFFPSVHCGHSAHNGK